MGFSCVLSAYEVSRVPTGGLDLKKNSWVGLEETWWMEAVLGPLQDHPRLGNLGGYACFTMCYMWLFCSFGHAGRFCDFVPGPRQC